jgi:hypothetical protein
MSGTDRSEVRYRCGFSVCGHIQLDRSRRHQRASWHLLWQIASRTSARRLHISLKTLTRASD